MTITLNREKLRATRKEKELTQEKLAECSAISDRYVRSLEAGARSHPRRSCIGSASPLRCLWTSL